MTDHITLQAQLDAANQRILALESTLGLDGAQLSVNAGDMPHEPCDLVKHVAEEVKANAIESHQTTVNTAVIVSKIYLLMGILGAVALPTFSCLIWLAMQTWRHDVRIVEVEFGLREVAQQIRSAQPSTVAKSP